MNQKNNHRKMTLTLLQVYLETKQMMLQVLRRRLATKIRGGGSVVGHETKFRNRTEGNKGLMKDYFDPDPVYDDKDFRRRFRMKRSLFLKIVEKVQETDTFLVKKKNAAGKLGFSPIQKVTAAIRQLAYGMSADSLDEYLRTGESTALVCLTKFATAIITAYKDEYLRRPNEEDMKRLLAHAESVNFPGMIGSIDCMHWEWKNCPKALHGQYQGRSGKPTLILEAVADHELWFWHAFFGLPGAMNDINVLQRSHVMQNVLEGDVPDVEVEINGKPHHTPYYLADGIYPKYNNFVKTIPNPQTAMEMNFAAHQESTRKDVERAFGVLQARFAIVQSPARLWKNGQLSDIMNACIILHNMIVEDERNQNLGYDYYGVTPQVSFSRDRVPRPNEESVSAISSLKDDKAHELLQKNLVAHKP